MSRLPALLLDPCAAPQAASAGVVARPRVLGRAATLALGGCGVGRGLLVVGIVLAGQGSAAIPLMLAGTAVGTLAVPGWLELSSMYPERVGGLAAICAHVFRRYGRFPAALAGVGYWWGWVTAAALAVVVSARALHDWYLPGVGVHLVALGLVLALALVVLAGTRVTALAAIPLAAAPAALFAVTAAVPALTGRVHWHAVASFQLATPFRGLFGSLTSVGAGLYLAGSAASGFEAATCHTGEMRHPERDLPAAVWGVFGLTAALLAVAPAVWSGLVPRSRLEGALANALGPAASPLLGSAARAAALWLVVLGLLGVTLHTLTAASRLLAQLSEDGLLPVSLSWRLRATSAPAVSVALGAVTVAGLAVTTGVPTRLLAAANLGYLISLSLPGLAVWTLRRRQPYRRRPYEAGRVGLALGLVASTVWMASASVGLAWFGMGAVTAGLAVLAGTGLLVGWRSATDARRRVPRQRTRRLQTDLTGAALAGVAALGVGYVVAVGHLGSSRPGLVAALEDLLVVVGVVGVPLAVVLPGVVAAAVADVSNAVTRLAAGPATELDRHLEQLAGVAGAGAGEVVDTRIGSSELPWREEFGAIAAGLSRVQARVERGLIALGPIHERVRRGEDELERLVDERTIGLVAAMVAANEALEQMQADRRELLKRTVRVAEDERSRVAADLHDGPIQRLAALMFVLDRAEMRSARQDNEGTAALIDKARTDLTAEISGLRRIMSELRPPVLDQGGLSVAVRDLVKDHQDRTGMAVSVSVDPTLAISRDSETVLYRVVQEAMANVAKHSGAERVVVKVRAAEDGVEVLVRDNGTGFELEPGTRLVRQGHFGLAVMRERMDLAGGRLEVHSTPGVGTEVYGYMPGSFDRGELPPLMRSATIRAGSGPYQEAQVAP